MKPCNKVFERIYSGQIEDNVTFRSTNPDAEVYTVLALQQATPGHTLVTSTECVPSMDELSPRMLKQFGIVSRATGIWLGAAFEPKYVAAVDAGVEVPHAHRHRIPAYEPNTRRYLEIMGAPDPKPFPEMSTDQVTEIYARATLHDEYARVVQASVDAGEELTAYTQLEEMAYDLRVPISRES
jgi:diadenosine tetraphosphate (Ap4A) HIT family hydrolase